MSATGRTPRELLDEMERDLSAAFRDGSPGRARRLRNRRRLAVVVSLAVAAGASTAAATRSIFSSAPPLPRLAPMAAVLASDPAGTHTWQLSVSRCSSPRDSVSVLLRTPSGGAGSPCGPLIQPPALFYDARGVVTFGVVPAGTTRVELALGGARRELSPSAADTDALRALKLPPQVGVYLVRLPAGAMVTALTAYDGSGHLLLVCQERRCTKP